MKKNILRLEISIFFVIYIVFTKMGVLSEKSVLTE